MINYKIIFSALSIALASNLALASDDEYNEYYYQRGPVPFEALDMNKDGVVTNEEHQAFRQERQTTRAKSGFRMRNASEAPSFEQIDADANGSINRQEMSQWRNQRMQQMRGRMRSAK